ncbi:MAG: hypothetical protein MUO22_03480, partial [Sedimentisphaerales bacterium]|nr:hypothetical protein [Sedimentisphaerales bacterium]
MTLLKLVSIGFGVLISPAPELLGGTVPEPTGFLTKGFSMARLVVGRTVARTKRNISADLIITKTLKPQTGEL